MIYNKIVLAGGNGYLGGLLAKHFSSLANEVIILSRKQKAQNGNVRTILWDGKTESEWTKAIEDADLLVNLCGKNVNCRYTKQNQQEIINSRVIPTRLLSNVIPSLLNPPKLWINITSATIYRHAEDRPQDEYTGEIGYGFSIDVCKAWESCFFETETPRTRKIALRMGIVLGRSDGAFPRLLNLVKLGLGGKQGDGHQFVNWVHEQDAIHSIQWLLKNEAINGVVNCTSPDAVTNNMLMKTIRKTYGIPFGLPTPAWLLSIGAAIIGTETELILKSRWVKPAVLLDNGFEFQYRKIEDAVHDIVSLRI
ncbi:TIGR01777 family oxidoreductase [Pedobacter sp. MC2016-05]|uniref:TIGR01777 family oxidoreductase n=1 Tax=Pedobacter sp. MC2016-05 TaxID=2994474 RepID=UPI00224620E5|nr:TIGR01777 family oxidoreductase [Pedobacter sp. MC2016-05]MCX2473159.1 TIGR01777 family oxidoreductase [Pedobacter sp. MC2016-05]